MITGRVRGQEAVFEIEVTGAAGSSRRCEAVIDTGFNGTLTAKS